MIDGMVGRPAKTEGTQTQFPAPDGPDPAKSLILLCATRKNAKIPCKSLQFPASGFFEIHLT